MYFSERLCRVRLERITSTAVRPNELLAFAATRVAAVTNTAINQPAQPILGKHALML